MLPSVRIVFMIASVGKYESSQICSVAFNFQRLTERFMKQGVTEWKRRKIRCNPLHSPSLSDRQPTDNSSPAERA
jgi:hypothetical protein